MFKKQKQKTALNPEELRRLYTRANLLSAQLNGRSSNFRDRTISAQYNAIRLAVRDLVNDPQFNKTITPVWSLNIAHVFIAILIVLEILGVLYLLGGIISLAVGGVILFFILAPTFFPSGMDVTDAPPWYFASTLGEVSGKLQLLNNYLQEYLESNYPSRYRFQKSDTTDKKDNLEKEFERLKERNADLRREINQKNIELEQLRKEVVNLPELKQENYGLNKQIRYMETELAGTREELFKHNIISKPIFRVEHICNRFHVIAKQLTKRHDQRNSLSIQDEYDVQDLIHSLLQLYFDDIRPEEWAPSYAGGAKRMDFLLPSEKLVIEIKKTRSNLDDRKIGEQLIIDIENYRKHPDCKTLVCFVYDPDEILKNPKGLENDINRQSGDISVKLLISPNRYFPNNS